MGVDALMRREPNIIDIVGIGKNGYPFKVRKFKRKCMNKLSLCSDCMLRNDCDFCYRFKAERGIS